MGRIACILVADFPLAALVRENPALRDAILGLGESTAAGAELQFVSLRAASLGIHPGMTVAQARALCAALEVSLRFPAAERNAAEALLAAARLISPVVEAGEDGCVWLDLSGLSRIYQSEDKIAAELVRRVLRVGMEPAVGIAAGRELATLAARCGGIRIIAAGRERDFSAGLPLDLLDLAQYSAELEPTLARWGLRRLGELARLDPRAVGTRLGRPGAALVRLAQGRYERPLSPCPLAETFAVAVDLEFELDSLEPFNFIMHPLLERLVEQLEQRGFVAGDIILTLGLSGHGHDSRRIAVSAPANDPRALLTLINLSLASSPPKAAVKSIQLEIEPLHPRPVQTDLFLPPTPAPLKLQTTLARLAALCGPERIGTLTPDNSYRPEAVRLGRFEPPAPVNNTASAPYSNTARAGAPRAPPGCGGRSALLRRPPAIGARRADLWAGNFVRRSVAPAG
jgi:protein ImuB